MHAAEEYQSLGHGLYFWQSYDPAVKTELCCCAMETAGGLVFCDPVPLAAEPLEELTAERAVRGIVLTSGNHERGAAALAARFGVEVWAHTGARGEVGATKWFGDGTVLFDEVEAISLEGFAVGETAFFWKGVLLVGDALINLPPYGFSVLPEKYCEDLKKGRESLRKLLRHPVELVTFAHGLPIVARARERLAGLIGGTDEG